MLSRVADSVYWMTRYVERVENLARFIDVTLNMMLDFPDGTTESWKALVSTTGDLERFSEQYGESTQENVIHFLAFDRSYPNSIYSCLNRARENARCVRESISSEMWEQLNQFNHMVADADPRRVTQDPHEFFEQVRMSGLLFQGITDGTMARDEGWHFTQLGRLLERADKTSRILDVKYYVLLPKIQDVGTPIDDLQWSAVLRSVSGFEIYRKRYHGITPSRVVEFLVLDANFPRAIQYCLEQAALSLDAVSHTPSGAICNLAQQRLDLLRFKLADTSIDHVMAGGLHEFLVALQTSMNEIDNAIYGTFIDMQAA